MRMVAEQTGDSIEYVLEEDRFGTSRMRMIKHYEEGTEKT